VVNEITSGELDIDRTAYVGDLRVTVSAQRASAVPSWYVYLEGPGGRTIHHSSDSLSAAMDRAGHLVEVLGGAVPFIWQWSSAYVRAAEAREARYKQALRDAQAERLGYWQELAQAAEAVGYPNARSARWAAGRY